MTRIGRRRLLKFSGAGAVAASTGGMAAILASGRAPVWMGTEGAPENLQHGDTVEIEITGIGALRNPVVREGR